MGSTYYSQIKHSDPRRWICIYPAYLNGTKIIAQGRRLVLNKCVDDPTVEEIKEVLEKVGYEITLEDKVYTREVDKDNPVKRGRVRVHFKNDDGTLINTNYRTKDSLLIYTGPAIKKLRTDRQNAAFISAATASANLQAGLAQNGTILEPGGAVVNSQGAPSSTINGDIPSSAATSGTLPGTVSTSGATPSNAIPSGATTAGVATGMIGQVQPIQTPQNTTF